MILEQYYLACLSHASYLIGDTSTKTAVVVDPQRDVDQYIADARAKGLAIRHVFLTHFHADFVAGHLELRDRCGAVIHLGARAQADYAFEPAHEGDVIELGRVRLAIRETPGHTPEGISILVYDLEKSAEMPHAVLTGDTLFIGDVGRPDLMASIGASASDLAGDLYDSLHEKLLTLPDETLVYPAHGAGSMCGKNLSSETVSTIGAQRQHNYALQPMGRRDFIRMATADLPEAPAYFARDAAINRSERATLDANLKSSLKPLALEDVLRLSKSGAQILDVRDPAEFEAAHLAGAISLGLGGKFATWAGTLLDPEKPIAIIANPGREREAALRLGRVGFDRVAGYLAGGMRALESREDLLRSTRRLDAHGLASEIVSTSPPIVIDVRTPREWNEAHIDGSLNLPLNKLEARIGEVPRGKELALHCQTGYRSAIAASLLERHGITDCADLAGGIVAWQASGLATVSAT